jgi:hypothetical protein
MTMKRILAVAALGAMLSSTGLALAQSSTNKIQPPPGRTEFPACCDSCNDNGCTGCNSGPQGLSCGKGLVLAECGLKDNKVNCKEKESRPGASAPATLKSN